MSNGKMTATYLNVLALIEERLLLASYVRSRYDDLQLQRVPAHICLLRHTLTRGVSRY